MTKKNQIRKRQRPAWKHYDLSLPQSLYEEVEIIAKREGATVAYLFREFIKLGVWMSKPKKKHHAGVKITVGGKRRILALI